jgi:hypothetical protein
MASAAQAANFSVVTWTDNDPQNTPPLVANNGGVDASHRVVTNRTANGRTVTHRLESSAKFVASNQTPELKAYTGVSNGGQWNDYSFTDSNDFTLSEALAVQEYEYTGDTELKISSTFRLHGGFVLESENTTGVLMANFGLIRGSFSGGNDLIDNLYAVNEDNLNIRTTDHIFGSQGVLASSELMIDRRYDPFQNPNPGPYTFSDQVAEQTLDFTLNKGDRFYVIAALSAQIYGPGITDAENTFTMNFFETGNPGAPLSSIVPVGAVPLPAAVWFFGSALLGLFGLRRRARLS